MKQLGNLAVICAKRDDLCLSICKGIAVVHLGYGPDRVRISVDWTDDDAIKKLTCELNHGKYQQKPCMTAE